MQLKEKWKHCVAYAQQCLEESKPSLFKSSKIYSAVIIGGAVCATFLSIFTTQLFTALGVAIGLCVAGTYVAIVKGSTKKIDLIYWVIKSLKYSKTISFKDYVEHVINHKEQNASDETSDMLYLDKKVSFCKDTKQVSIQGVNMYNEFDKGNSTQYLLSHSIFDFIWAYCESHITTENAIQSLQKLINEQTLHKEMSSLTTNEKIQIVAGVKTFFDDLSEYGNIEDKCGITDLTELLCYYIGRTNVTLFTEFDTKLKQFNKEFGSAIELSSDIKNELQNQLWQLNMQDQAHDKFKNNMLNDFVKGMVKQNV